MNLTILHLPRGTFMTNKNDSQEVRLPLFLEELTALSKKYGFYIGGCGCCGSPSLFDETLVTGTHYVIDSNLDNLNYE